MAATRRKAAAQPAPQTIEEATELLGRYAGMLTQVEQLRANADTSIAQIQALRDTFIAPIEEEAKGLFLQLRAWWGVAGATLTEGKRKSYELAGCVLGVRTTPPSLKMPAKKDEAAAAILKDAGLDMFCRVKFSVDKPALLKEIAAIPQLRETLAAKTEPFEAAMQLMCRVEWAEKAQGLGFAPRQREEFFIDRAAPKPETPEVVADPAVQELAA
jgi:phage host-nuclease inhibitor protein Gam